MDTKICTIGGGCITCMGHSPREIRDAIAEFEKAGNKFWCCGEKCIRIEHISTITEARTDGIGEGEGEDRDRREDGIEIADQDVPI
jgi:hypothetical protein